MHSGLLRHKISIQSLTETASTATGELIQGWSTGISVWARVEPLRGREYFAAAQAIAQNNDSLPRRHGSHDADRARLRCL
jgi:SPP1 family predicted phage head-tail adaptor